MIDAHMTAVSSVLQYVAVCCSMLQCDVVCCVMINAHITAVSSVLQYVAVCVCVYVCRHLPISAEWTSVEPPGENDIAAIRKSSVFHNHITYVKRDMHV